VYEINKNKTDIIHRL